MEENIAAKIARSRAEYEAHIKGPMPKFDTSLGDVRELRSRVAAIEAHLVRYGPTDLDGKPLFTPFTPEEADDVQSGEYQIHDTKVGPVMRKGDK